jgi:hypothetical protein
MKISAFFLVITLLKFQSYDKVDASAPQSRERLKEKIKHEYNIRVTLAIMANSLPNNRPPTKDKREETKGQATKKRGDAPSNKSSFNKEGTIGKKPKMKEKGTDQRLKDWGARR